MVAGEEWVVGVDADQILPGDYLAQLAAVVAKVPARVGFGIIVVLALLTFVLSRYLYPSSQPGRLNAVSNVLGIVWTVALAWVLWTWPADHRVTEAGWWRDLAALSLFYPVFYLAASWWVTAQKWRGRARLAERTAADEA